MKCFILALIVAATTTAASAGCFVFVNGKGPAQIGNFKFAAPAKSVCINKVTSINGHTRLGVTFTDDEGALAIATAIENGVGRCAGICRSLELTSGNVNGVNRDFTGTNMVIDAQIDRHLGISKGTLEIQAGRSFPKKFLIMGSI